MPASVMKNYPRILFIFIFLFVTSPGLCEFNIFQQRNVIIGEFSNKGDTEYDYLADSLRTRIYTYALSIPFLTLTDEERLFLEELSIRDEFEDAFLAADSKISYRMIPLIEKGTLTYRYQSFSERRWPIYIHGNFTVISEEEIYLEIYAHNGITGRKNRLYQTQITLYSLINEPHTYLIPFFKIFLQYKVYSASIDAVPQDSYIFIDERLVGIGSAKNIFLPQGQHRLSVIREGYIKYTDFINLNEDGFFTSVELQEIKKRRSFSIFTDPVGADIYMDEQFMGITPLELKLTGNYHTFTIIKKGYSQVIVSSLSLPHDQDILDVKLISPDITEKQYHQAETHLKRAKISAITGLGMLGASIILGTKKTLYHQEADLYRETKPRRYYQASMDASRVFLYLTVTSSVITGGIFTYSFIQIIKYFTLYSPEAGQPDANREDTINLFKTEVSF